MNFPQNFGTGPPKKITCKWSLNSIPQHELAAMGEAIEKMTDQILADVILDSLKNGDPLELQLCRCDWDDIVRIAKNNDKLREYISDPNNNVDFIKWVEEQLENGN